MWIVQRPGRGGRFTALLAQDGSGRTLICFPAQDAGKPDHASWRALLLEALVLASRTAPAG